MEINQLQNSEQITQKEADVFASKFSTEDLKKITDFFSILIKIDKRQKAKGDLKNEKK